MGRDFSFVVLFVAAASVVGSSLGGAPGAIFAGLTATGWMIIIQSREDRHYLALMRARPITRQSHALAYEAVHAAARKAEVVAPSIWVFPCRQPNAFSVTGLSHGNVIAFSSAVLDLLNAKELNALVEYELARLSTTRLSNSGWKIAALLAPVRNLNLLGTSKFARTVLWISELKIAWLLRPFIFHGDVYRHDRAVADCSREPLLLAKVIFKISSAAERHSNIHAARHPAISSLFFVAPSNQPVLPRTHPHAMDRVRRLRLMAEQRRRHPV